MLHLSKMALCLLNNDSDPTPGNFAPLTPLSYTTGPEVLFSCKCAQDCNLEHPDLANGLAHHFLPFFLLGFNYLMLAAVK